MSKMSELIANLMKQTFILGNIRNKTKFQFSILQGMGHSRDIVVIGPAGPVSNVYIGPGPKFFGKIRPGRPDQAM